jgi:hypothetical protein
MILQHGDSVHEDERRALFEQFTAEEVHVMSLVALGWNVTSIETRRGLSRYYMRLLMKSCETKTGKAGLGMGMFYVDHLLPFDTQGGYEPGEKHTRWRSRAEERRTQLRGMPDLLPVMFRAVAAQATPETVDLSNEELGALLSPPVGKSAYSGYMTAVTTALRVISEKEQRESKQNGRPVVPSFNGRGRLLTVARLAPFAQ